MTDIEAWAIAWWAVVLRGVSAVAFGLLALFAPWQSFSALVICFACYALADGACAVLAAARGMSSASRWGVALVQGMIGIAVGVVTLAAPVPTTLALVHLVATWAIATGVLEMFSAFRLRRTVRSESLLALSGGSSLGLGLLLVAYPELSSLTLMTLLGVYGLAVGGVLIALGVRAYHWQDSTEPVFSMGEAN